MLRGWVLEINLRTGNNLNPDKGHALGIQSPVQNWRRGKYGFDTEVMTQEKNHRQLEQRGKKHMLRG